MIEMVFLFGGALGLILLAQIGETKRWARWAVYVALLILGLLALIAGVAALLNPEIFRELGDDINTKGFGWLLIATGLAIFLPVVAAMFLAPGRGDDTGRGRAWTRPVYLTAWALMVAFIGSNFAVAVMKNLSELELESPLSLILIQNLTFALAALLGVGWGVRRDWRQAVTRLGLSRPTWRGFLIGAGMSLVMLASTIFMGGILALFFGEELNASSGFNQQILNQLPGGGGVLIMGLATGGGEEMLYRGALQPVAGLWLTSLLFAISHVQYLNPAILVIFVLGLLLGLTRRKWGLTTAIWSHALYNSLVGLLALLAMNLDQFTTGR